MCKNLKIICLCKIYEFQSINDTRICMYYLYINDVSFLLMVWCEVCKLYILNKSMQLLWCDFV
jgi:hypothetical protein